jgi:hypothetical protein
LGTEAAAAYDVAVSRLRELQAPRFETPARPAELTPQQSLDVRPAPQPVPDQAPAPMPGSMSGPVSAPLPPPPGQGWASGAPVGALPGIPDIGGSLAGLVTWIAQTLGSHADPPTTGGIVDTTDVATPEDPVAEVKSVAPERHSSPKTLPVADVAAPVAEVPAPLLAAEVPPAETPVAPSPPTAPSPPPAETPVAPPPPPAPPAQPAAADVATPCEIAADELPRVGQ